MAVNKVNFGGNTLIDLTGDTLESAEQLLKGIIAHAKDGSKIEGTLEAGGGGYEVSFGLINLAEDSKTITFEHGLSKAPDYVSIFLPIGYSYASYANSLRTYYKQHGISSIGVKHDVYATMSSKSYAYHESGMAVGEVAFTIDDTTVTALECTFASTSARTWMSGKPYMWICISGDVVFPYK